jgi:hypothetical protein
VKIELACSLSASTFPEIIPETPADCKPETIFRAIRDGRLAEVTDHVERVLGHKPIAFDQWAQQNAAAFV